MLLILFKTFNSYPKGDYLLLEITSIVSLKNMLYTANFFVIISIVEFWTDHITKFVSTVLQNLEAVVQWCSMKKVFSEISQNSQENTYARVSFLIKFSWSLQLRHWCFAVNTAKFLRIPIL